ncbi:MAG TPA: glucuronate isomerase [Spirochaetota bacterium]|nr:glucuronate isomerase [Spirochaetota bacterium]
MERFIHDDFMLQSESARRLFHDYAAAMPIIDYHCHLDPGRLSADHRFGSVTEAWLEGDHYKWRAMRANGIDERLITGDAGDREKFRAWARTVPRTLRNPLYHWTHLELARVFGIDDRLLSDETADWIFDACNEALASPGFGARSIVKKFNVETVCTTDDPVDSLEHHRAWTAGGEAPFALLPAWRPDRALAVDRPHVFGPWRERLEERTGIRIRKYDDLLDALDARHEFFHEAGCRLSDHGLESIPSVDWGEKRVRGIFARALKGEAVAEGETIEFQSALLHRLAVMDWGKGWAQQFHVGVLRNTNARMFVALGQDTGYDSIGDFAHGRSTSRFLDRLDRRGQLARTILYTINPADNALFATMIGNFQDGSVPGKLQFGSGWWFLDQKDGMEAQMNALSNMGLLARFIGMTTDSRSFLSFPRHEYFRRVLCNLIGSDMETGLVPRDTDLLGRMVQDICYFNARDYFAFPV